MHAPSDKPNMEAREYYNRHAPPFQVGPAKEPIPNIMKQSFYPFSVFPLT